MGRGLIPERQLPWRGRLSPPGPGTRRTYPVLARVSPRYSLLEGRLPTCYSPVRRFTPPRREFLARLACMRHAASVRSEPGSNSPVLRNARLSGSAERHLPGFTGAHISIVFEMCIRSRKFERPASIGPFGRLKACVLFAFQRPGQRKVEHPRRTVASVRAPKRMRTLGERFGRVKHPADTASAEGPLWASRGRPRSSPRTRHGIRSNSSSVTTQLSATSWGSAGRRSTSEPAQQSPKVGVREGIRASNRS